MEVVFVDEETYGPLLRCFGSFKPLSLSSSTDSLF